MKARPRSVERSVAEYLSVKFAQLGCAPVERIPVLGRTGPDLTTNELNLVIDVKSRKEVPASLFFPAACPFLFDTFLAVPLKFLWTALDENRYGLLDFSSVLVRQYWHHMDEWTRANMPDGISAVVLHRPTEPIGSSILIIHLSDHRRMILKCLKIQTTPN